MKKLIATIIGIIVAIGAMMAQSSQLATLSHEGLIRTFYGADALKNAHEIAEDGDVITLSSGSFNAVTITKAITLRGVGVGKDSSNNALPTIINSFLSIQVPANENLHFTMEGISTAAGISCLDASNPLFLKCRIGGNFNVYRTNNITIMHCMVSANAAFNSSTAGTIINSVFHAIDSMYNFTCTNSVIYNLHLSTYKNSTTTYTIKNTNIYNSIFIPTMSDFSGANANAKALHSSNMAYNCVAGCLYHNGSPQNPFRLLPDYSSDTCLKDDALKAIFAASANTFSGCESTLFQLSETGKQYKGNDGKEVGAYGGNMPFDLRTTTPQITKCNVAAKSTVDGKLSVDIEVSEIE